MRPGCVAVDGLVACASSCVSERTGGMACPSTPGLPDPALVKGEWIPRMVLPEPPEGMPVEFDPRAVWMLPPDAMFEVVHPESLEEAYAVLAAAVRRILVECLELRTKWANNTEAAHVGAAVPRAVAYQYVAGQLHRAYEGAAAIHPPQEYR